MARRGTLLSLDEQIYDKKPFVQREFGAVEDTYSCWRGTDSDAVGIDILFDSRSRSRSRCCTQDKYLRELYLCSPPVFAKTGIATQKGADGRVKCLACADDENKGYPREASISCFIPARWLRESGYYPFGLKVPDTLLSLNFHRQ